MASQAAEAWYPAGAGVLFGILGVLSLDLALVAWMLGPLAAAALAGWRARLGALAPPGAAVGGLTAGLALAVPAYRFTLHATNACTGDCPPPDASGATYAAAATFAATGLLCWLLASRLYRPAPPAGLDE